MESFGEYIRNQRELRLVTKEEVSNVTKVSLRYLEALESDKWEFLPCKPFVVGFLRAYSKYLGLDDDAVVTRYISCNSDPAYEEITESDYLRKRRIARIMVTSSALFLLVVVSILLISIV